MLRETPDKAPKSYDNVHLLFHGPTVASLTLQITHAQANRVAPENMEDVLAYQESLSEEEAELLLAEKGEESRTANKSNLNM